jgi:hypothetical protein
MKVILESLNPKNLCVIFRSKFSSQIILIFVQLNNNTKLFLLSPKLHHFYFLQKCILSNRILMNPLILRPINKSLSINIGDVIEFHLILNP